MPPPAKDKLSTVRQGWIWGILVKELDANSIRFANNKLPVNLSAFYV